MAPLIIALSLVAICGLVLVFVRLKARSRDEMNGSLLFMAIIASWGCSGASALGLVGGLLMLSPDGVAVPGNRTWLSLALEGAIYGFVLFVLCRLVLILGASALFNWTCRLPMIDEPKYVFRGAIWGALGFSIIGMVIVLITSNAELPMAISILIGAALTSLIPLYEVLLQPWLQYARSPRLSSKRLEDVQSWADRVCSERNLPRVRIRVQDGRLMNAFAIGGLVRHLVVIGGGLVEKMSSTQIKSIVAHELAHVARRDVPRLLVPLVVAGATCSAVGIYYISTPLFAAETVLSTTMGGLCAGLSWVTFYMVIPGFFMRRMELQADRLAAEFLGSGVPLADALVTSAKLNDQALDQWSWSHPSMQDRVDALRALSDGDS